jgi:putative Flp pilus-assembly TadE/G-like protein
MLNRKRRAQDEQGFIMVVTAIVMTMMILFAGLAIDVGSWNERGAELKRAADAAALAGVVWMPDFNKAQQVALDTAQKNGFTNGVNNVTVSVQQVANNNRQLKVTITDGKAKQWFSKLATGSQAITRGSTAEYVLPVPLGSPKNTFGTGNLLGGSDTENFWAAVNGYCAGHESGDDRLAFYESYTSTSGATQCNNGSAQSGSYDSNGYLYAIELPTAVSALKLEVYDAAFYNSGSTSDNALGSGAQTITTTYKIYDRNPTPLDLSNLTLLKTTTLAADTTSPTNYQNQWVNFYTWNNAAAGTYYVRVYTKNGELNSRGSNGFALRAYTGSSFATCSTITGSSNYSASCPQIHGVDAISVYANFTSTTPSFYLAQVDPIHAGKTMRVTLFDPGEGASSIQILDPNGNPATFNWSTPCNPPPAPAGGCSATNVSSIDVSGTGTQAYSPVNGSSKFNDRYLVVDVPIPVNYTAQFGTKVWWKIKYTVASSPTDRTTWNVNIVGDPVHLLT